MMRLIVGEAEILELIAEYDRDACSLIESASCQVTLAAAVRDEQMEEKVATKNYCNGEAFCEIVAAIAGPSLKHFEHCH